MKVKAGLNLRHRSVLLVLLAATVLLSVIGCDDEEEVLFFADEFVGTYEGGHRYIVGAIKTDSVRLTFDQPEHYVIEYYDPVSRVDFCNSEGVVLGRGTPEMRFYPDTLTSINCDTIRGIQGRIFEVQFGSTDSLWLDCIKDPPDDSLFRFRLHRVE